MTFNDILKSSFLEKAVSFSVVDVSIALLLAFVLGMFILAVYKKTFTGVLYSQSFGVSLVAMAMVTTLIILAVTSNVILSLGMVGALSIVRFRTALKEPIDIAFLFWSISVGIVLGAGLIPLAIIGSIFIGIAMVLLVNTKQLDTPYILVVNCETSAISQMCLEIIASKVKKYIVKSRSESQNGAEITVEVRLKDKNSDIVHMLSHTEGVTNAVLVSYNGDYLS